MPRPCWPTRLNWLGRLLRRLGGTAARPDGLEAVLLGEAWKVAAPAKEVNLAGDFVGEKKALAGARVGQRRAQVLEFACDASFMQGLRLRCGSNLGQGGKRVTWTVTRGAQQGETLGKQR